ncbi:hypothetical protein ACFCYX_12970 [Streptomyces populi]|uniref:hypothetical protein n=1 Tax=Streptomyces populi TaxID=2058924 RepID=UPI0035E0236A
MGVGSGLERRERAGRAVGGRPGRTPEPGTGPLVGRAAKPDASSGRRPEAGPLPEREPGAWFGPKGARTAAPSSPARTVRTRPSFRDTPATGPLPDTAPDPGRPLPGSREDSGEPASGHDPHEVTVQLDSASVGADGRTVRPGKDAPAAAGASDVPVFVDESGRRSRRFRRLGMFVAVACAVYAVVIVATLLSGSSNAPWLPVPGQEEDAPAGRAETSPRPAQPVNPSGTPGATAPGAVATATDGTTPSSGPVPTTSASVSASASATGASSSPRPSTSATRKSDPGVTTKSPAPDPEPSSSADGRPTPSAPATTPGATPTPTETAGPTGSTGEGAGTG